MNLCGFNFSTMKTFLICIGIGFSIMFISCKKDMASIIRKWKMVDDDIVLEINKDSTYNYIEHNNPKQGSWKFAPGDTIILGSAFKINTLNEKSLILEDGNGEKLNFVAADK